MVAFETGGTCSTCGEDVNSYTNWENPRRRLKDDTKMNFKEISYTSANWTGRGAELRK